MRVFTNKHILTNDYLCEYDVQPHTQSHTVKRSHTHTHTHTQGTPTHSLHNVPHAHPTLTRSHGNMHTHAYHKFPLRKYTGAMSC